MSDAPGTGTGTTSVDPPAPAPPAAPPARRSLLAISLTAVTGVLAVGSAVVTAVILTHRPHHAPAPAHPLRGTVFQLRPGQCTDFGLNGSAVAHVVPCAQPHDAEIYGTLRVAGRHWPGTAELSQQARQGCQSRLSGYVNPQLDPASLAEFYVYPNPGAWAAGGRSVICEIRGAHGKLTGSVRASGG